MNLLVNVRLFGGWGLQSQIWRDESASATRDSLYTTCCLIFRAFAEILKAFFPPLDTFMAFLNLNPALPPGGQKCVCVQQRSIVLAIVQLMGHQRGVYERGSVC